MDTKQTVGIIAGIAIGVTGGLSIAPADVKIEYVDNPARVVEVLNSIDFNDEQMAKLAPKYADGTDIPKEKLLFTNSTIEAYFAEAILEGKPPVLGGTLNSWELQDYYRSIAEKNGVLTAEELLEGSVDIYKELRK